MIDVPRTPVFGLAGEGPSDYVIIRHILAGFFGAPAISLNQLQPVVDITGGLITPGGWVEVLRFCRSAKFEAAFQFNDYVIVQVDTDVCEETGFDVPRRSASGHDLGPREIHAQVRERIISAIGLDVFSRREKQILFAICVESIECWLLPIYWNDSRREKIINCLSSLNEKLLRAEKFSIDRNDKHIKYYRRICRPLSRRGDLMKHSQHNPSFALFIDELTRTGSASEIASPGQPASDDTA